MFSTERVGLPVNQPRIDEDLEDREDLEYVDAKKRKISDSPSLPDSADRSSTVLPMKISLSSIMIPERDNPDLVRVYRLSDHFPGKSIVFYRCWTCETIWARIKHSGGGSSEKRFSPTVKVVHGELVGNAYPEHHPDCRPVAKAVQYIDETPARFISRNNDTNSEAAETSYDNKYEFLLIFVDFGFFCVQLVDHLIWAYDQIAVLEARGSSVSYFNTPNPRTQVNVIQRYTYKYQNLRIPTDLADPEDPEVRTIFGVCAIGDALSGDGTAPLIVAQPDGETVRIYHLTSRSVVGNMHAFYQCTSCDYFCRKEEKNIAATSGQSSSVPARAELKAENGIICGDLYPAHHADCIPTSLHSLRTLGESLRDFHVVRDRRIISLKAVDVSYFH
ncbi:unnamed protein product [Gongylonema pulchrum]|uniref:DUF295 domain-containing protein n=1 Tax=Gongylonema pulchrum TaxID=637853 RepID=A0A183DYQ8_9BILA|nr:unnamed protein product [Gongylonema pulchrum]